MPRRALPARFRRIRVLIVGCGDVGQRVVQQLLPTSSASQQRPHVLALTSTPDKAQNLRNLGVTPLVGNLDHPASLRRLAGIAQRVVHLAPPPNYGIQDRRSMHLRHALGRGRLPQRLVYGSTTGVYGDCAGQWVDETHGTQAYTDRAQRRVHAEQQWRAWGLQSGVTVSVLRIPGIYAPNREGGTPRSRLLKGLPVLVAEEDVYTNHIHADDLATIVLAALWRGAPRRTYHACDDTELRMGDYFDLAADLYSLPRPPRVTLEAATQMLPATMLSFMSESRRLRNERMKRELKVQLRYPTVYEGLCES